MTLSLVRQPPTPLCQYLENTSKRQCNSPLSLRAAPVAEEPFPNNNYPVCTFFFFHFAIRCASCQQQIANRRSTPSPFPEWRPRDQMFLWSPQLHSIRAAPNTQANMISSTSVHLSMMMGGGDTTQPRLVIARPGLKLKLNQ